MSKKSNSGKATRSSLSNPTVLAAIIGVIGTIVVTLITISPQIIAVLRPPTETPIPTSTVNILPTSTPLPTETEALPEATPTVAPPNPTETAEPTPVDPGLSCLDRWVVVSSADDLATPNSSDGCAMAGYSGLGISTSEDELIFGQNNFRGQGIFGISTSLPSEATIILKVVRGILTQGEFWIALSNTPTPDSNMLIIAIQPEFGEVRTYVDQTDSTAGRFTWSQLVENTNYGDGPTYTYDFLLKTSGSKIDSRINFFDLPSQIVNLPNYLFIGYQNKSTLGSLTMNVIVSDLKISAGQ